jgi:hypothetical protein
MGIRFSCHACAKPLNIKSELAGRRGICPQCNTRFRIPVSDAEFSTPIEESRSAQTPPHDRSAGTAGGHSDPAVAAAETSNRAQNDRSAQTEKPVAAAEVARIRPAAAGQSATVERPTPHGEGLSVHSATWYVRPPSGGQYGPATSDVLQTWIAEGRVARTALLWRDGWPQWREAGEALPEIAESLPAAAAGAAQDVFGDSSAAGTEQASDQPQAAVETPLSGDTKIGAVRRQRTTQRMMWVSLLAVLAVALVITLVVVAGSRG